MPQESGQVQAKRFFVKVVLRIVYRIDFSESARSFAVRRRSPFYYFCLKYAIAASSVHFLRIGVHVERFWSITCVGDISEFIVPSTGSILGFRLETGAKSDGLHQRFNPRVRCRTFTRHLEVRKINWI